MDFNFLQMTETDSKELENYIKQIKSYEAQREIIECTVKEEEKLKKNHPEWELVLWTGIAGIHFHVDVDSSEGKRLMKSLKPGVELKLVREAENKYDRWAIAVYTKKNEMLGYVTRYKNETIARLMDAGHVFHAFVENECQVNFQVPKEQRAFTENFDVPYSIWME